jgi:hypothetical protein
MRHLIAVVGLVVFVPVLSAQDPTQQVPRGQMPTLGRPTESSDKVPLFDFDDYFIGKWTFEWSVPDSPLGPAGDITGTTIVTRLSPGYYEAQVEGTGPSGKFRSKEIWAYQKDNHIVARTVLDPKGAMQYMQIGPIGGDLGGIYNIHLESAPYMAGGKSVRFRSVLKLLSPLSYRVAMSLSVNDGPFTNLGNPWWRKDLSYVGKK